MFNKFCVMVAAAVPLPILAQIDPETTAGKLATASAQGVLAVVVVCEAIAIVWMFRTWRNDLEKRRDEEKEVYKSLIENLSENTAVMAQTRDSQERNARALEGFETTGRELKTVLESVKTRG